MKKTQAADPCHPVVMGTIACETLKKSPWLCSVHPIPGSLEMNQELTVPSLKPLHVVCVRGGRELEGIRLHEAMKETSISLGGSCQYLMRCHLAVQLKDS